MIDPDLPLKMDLYEADPAARTAVFKAEALVAPINTDTVAPFWFTIQYHRWVLMGRPTVMNIVVKDIIGT